jgi:hypothetical protein
VRRNKSTRVRHIKGAMRTRFDDLLVPASPHVTALIRDGILHDFRPGDLRAFRAGYLAGFAAERHHQTVAEGLRANEEDKALLIRNRIKAHAGRQDLYDIGYRTDTTGIHYRRILLPVWILHYTHVDRPYRVVVSGIDGRSFGERPFSRDQARALFRSDHRSGDRGRAGLGGGGIPLTGKENPARRKSPLDPTRAPH